MDYLDLFEKYLSKVKKSSGSNYVALCPFHDDHNPSFSFDAETGLWQCFACGEKGNAWQFADRMNDEEWKRKITAARKKEQSRIVENWKKDAIKQAPKIEQTLKEKKIVKETVYLYHDKQGNVAYEKTRYDFEDGSKTFKIEWKTIEKKHLLYDLACLQYIEPKDISEIWFCEGEKCREALLEETDGRSDVLIFAYSVSPEQEIKNSNIQDYIEGKRVIIFCDNDEIGEKKASQIVAYAKKYANRIDVVRFRDYEKGYDISDFLSEGHSVEEALVLATPEYVSTRYIVTDYKSFLANKPEPTEVMDQLYLIPKACVSMVAGMGSVGKGFFMLWNAVRWGEQTRVAYLSAEDSVSVLKKRMWKLVQKRFTRKKGDVEYLVDINQKGAVALDSVLGLDITALYDVVLSYIEQQYQIIIIDPIGAFIDENMNSEVSRFMSHLQHICIEYNVNIFLSHHIRKGRKGDEVKQKSDLMDYIRGASALHSNARFVWFLRRSAIKPTAIEVWNVKNSYLPNTRDFMIDMFGDMKMARIWLDQKGQTYTKELVDFFIFENQKFDDTGIIPIDATKMETNNKKQGEVKKHDNNGGKFV